MLDFGGSLCVIIIITMHAKYNSYGIPGGGGNLNWGRSSPMFFPARSGQWYAGCYVFVLTSIVHYLSLISPPRRSPSDL